MSGRTPPPSDPATAEAIGEIRGQLREIIHTMNNLGQRNEANSRILVKLEDTPDRLDKIEGRMTTLETAEHRREGATGLLSAILRSPGLGWLVGAATTIWAFVTGRLHL